MKSYGRDIVSITTGLAQPLRVGLIVLSPCGKYFPLFVAYAVDRQCSEATTSDSWPRTWCAKLTAVHFAIGINFFKLTALSP